MPSSPAHQFSRRSIVPIYLQIAGELIERIKRAELKPNEQLPSETDLINQYQVSRVTIRQAIKHLVGLGLAASRQGKGSFVLEPVIKHELGPFKGFYEELKRQGFNPVTEVLGMTVDPSDLPAEAAGLAGTGKHVVGFVRRYRIDTQAFAQVHAWFACDTVPSADALERLPVLALVMREFGSEIESAELGISAMSASAKLASSLEIKRNSPLLLLRRASFLINKKMCEYAEIHIRAERYEFRMTTEGPLSVTSAIHSIDKSKAGVPRIGSAGRTRKSNRSTLKSRP